MNDAKKEHLAKLLADPVLIGAIALGRKHFQARKLAVAVGADAALALALQHSYIAGANDVMDWLEKLTIQSNKIQPPPLVEWGQLTNPDERTSTANPSNPTASSTGENGGTGKNRRTARKAS